MIPYRRGLVRLPLQRSLFGKLGEAATLLGLADAVPGGLFGAWLDESGDLFLDRSHVARLVESLVDRLTPGYVETVERAHRACCASLAMATERAAHPARTADARELRSLVGELGERIAALIPYAVLSKFVPDALLRALDAAGDRLPPPFPRPSVGAELVERSLGLHRASLALGYPPERLAAQWPAVPPEVATLVRGFCNDHVGFGPLQWEARGYEDPSYVFGMLRAAFGDSTRELTTRAPSQDESTPPASGTAKSSAIRGHLAFWLDFLERETWYIRRAFYRGMIPLLRRLAAASEARRRGSGAEELLFLEIDELRSDAAPTDVEARLRDYLGDRGYLERHGVDATRLSVIFQEN